MRAILVAAVLAAFPSVASAVEVYRIHGEITAESVAPALEYLAAVKGPAVFEIDTPGGSVNAGFEIARAIELSPVPVVCVVDGSASSMGFYILQSCATRLMTRRSYLMTHEPSVGGEMAGGPREWQNMTDHLRVSRDAFAEHCAARLTISLESYHRRTDGGRDWFMGHEEARQIGAVDGVVPSLRVALSSLKR